MLPSSVRWLNVKGVWSGLSFDMFCDIFVALYLDVLSMSVFILFTLYAIDVIILEFVVSLVLMSWMWLFVLSDCVEKSI